MRLRELEAHFCRWYDNGKERGYGHVETLEEADGLGFLCPLCYKTNNGPVGTHMVLVAFSNAPDGTYMRNSSGHWPKWQVVSGSTLDDLQLAPSILLIGGCNWHGFVGSSGVPPGEAQ